MTKKHATETTPKRTSPRPKQLAPLTNDDTKSKGAAPTAVKSEPLKTQRKTKIDILTDALTAEGGTTIAALCSLTGWQSHSVRAAMTGLKKKGFAIGRTKTDEGSIYAITSTAETK